MCINDLKFPKLKTKNINKVGKQNLKKQTITHQPHPNLSEPNLNRNKNYVHNLKFRKIKGENRRQPVRERREDCKCEG